VSVDSCDGQRVAFFVYAVGHWSDFDESVKGDLRSQHVFKQPEGEKLAHSDVGQLVLWKRQEVGIQTPQNSLPISLRLRIGFGR
jgi:hypothetical protein